MSAVRHLSWMLPTAMYAAWLDDPYDFAQEFWHMNVNTTKRAPLLIPRNKECNVPTELASLLK